MPPRTKNTSKHPYSKGRPGKYNTDEEREAAKKAKTAEWQARNQDRVREIHRVARKNQRARKKLGGVRPKPLYDGHARIALGIFTFAEVQFFLGLSREEVLKVFGEPAFTHRGTGFSMQTVKDYADKHHIDEDLLSEMAGYLDMHLTYLTGKRTVTDEVAQKRIQNLEIARAKRAELLSKKRAT